MSDASLSIYVSDDTGGKPGRIDSCDWRDGRACKVPGAVLVHLAEIDDGAGCVYCRIHAEVMVNAAVGRMWRERFVAAQLPAPTETKEQR